MSSNWKDDIPKKFIADYDETFWMHFARELLIVFVMGFINLPLAVGLAIGINLTWEWKDGIHNDGFNIIDMTAGLIATVLGFLIHRVII